MTKPDESPLTNRCVVFCLTLTVILTMFGTVAGCTYAQQENVVKAGEGQGRQSAGYENEVVEEHPEVNSGGELWTDIQRQTHRLFAKDTSRFCVLTFVTTHCPVANAYQPVLRQLQEDFAEDRIDFYQINPTRSATSSQALQHTAECMARYVLAEHARTCLPTSEASEPRLDRLGASGSSTTLLCSP